MAVNALPRTPSGNNNWSGSFARQEKSAYPPLSTCDKYCCIPDAVAVLRRQLIVRDRLFYRDPCPAWPFEQEGAVSRPPYEGIKDQGTDERSGEHNNTQYAFVHGKPRGRKKYSEGLRR